MHLYLSSYRFGDEPGRLSTLLPVGSAAVVIANALDYTDDVPRKQASTVREIEALSRLGFTATELDLRSFFDRPHALRERLADIGLIWVVGGNAFLLRRALKQSGLDAYLLRRKGDNSFVYGGYSAGAIVVTPTLAGIEFVDPPDVLAHGYNPEIVWDGLGLVSYSIAPHYQSDHPESLRIARTIQYFVDNKLLFKALRDGDVIVSNA
jgi:dipeptidase E